VCGGMAAARLAELRHSRRSLERSGPAHEGRWSRATYPLIVALHAMVIGGTLFRGGRPRPAWLAVLLAAQPVRLWVLSSLGSRWNTRAAVPQRMDVVTTGPYAYVRHPNYSVVALELAALPLAFGLWRLAVLATLANAVLLGPRIREEEARLMALPGYREHFAGLPRFVPRLMPGRTTRRASPGA
jgi:methyltransferase